MPDKNEIKIEDLISLAEGSKITGYHQDYLGSLCRSGKLEGQKIGRNWTVSRKGLDRFMRSHGTGVKILDSESATGVTNNLKAVEIDYELFIVTPSPLSLHHYPSKIKLIIPFPSNFLPLYQF